MGGSLMKKGYLFILITAFLYSTHEIAAKFLAATAKMDPFQVVFLEFSIGLIFLIPLMLRDIHKRGLKLHSRDFKFFFVTGTLCIPVSLVLLQTSLSYTKASVASVIICANAIFIVPFAYFLLKEKLTGHIVFSLLLTLTGVIIIFNPVAFLAGNIDSRNMLGIVMALASSVAFSLFTVISAKRVHYYGGLILNCFSFICGVLVLSIGMILFNKPFFQGLTLPGLATLLYMGIFIKALGYLFYFEAIKQTTAVTASTVFMIKPALATVLAFLILGEALHLNILMGIVFIVVGSYNVYYFKKKETMVNLPH